jgi:hypothetical protein
MTYQSKQYFMKLLDCDIEIWMALVLKALTLMNNLEMVS